MKGSTVFYEDVAGPQGDVFGAVSVVCKNDLTWEEAEKNKSYFVLYVTSTQYINQM